MMEKGRRGRLPLIAAAFSGMLLLLALLLWQGVRRGSAVRVGIPKAPAAYGAAMLLQTPSAQYTCTLGSTPQALLDALERGDLDAALLPAPLARQASGCTICAVLGGEALVAVSRPERVSKLRDLQGADVVFSPEAEGSLSAEMLKSLLRDRDIRPDPGSGKRVYICMLEEAAALLAGQEGWQAGFAAAEEWRKRDAAPWPDGLCLAVRTDYLRTAGSDFDAFLRALEHSAKYAEEKRKKTVAMAAEAGLADSAEAADLLYPLCDFTFSVVKGVR